MTAFIHDTPTPAPAPACVVATIATTTTDPAAIIAAIKAAGYAAPKKQGSYAADRKWITAATGVTGKSAIKAIRHTFGWYDDKGRDTYYTASQQWVDADPWAGDY